jgi:putative tricarboxylic transport membrane protein
MGPQVADADYRQWVATFDKLLASPAFAKLRTEAGLYPFSLTGQALNEYVHKAVDDYGKRASHLGLVR